MLMNDLCNSIRINRVLIFALFFEIFETLIDIITTCIIRYGKR